VRHLGSPRPLASEWLPEAVAGTYLPLLEVLERLAEDNVPVRMTLSLSPTLLAMLSDEGLQAQVAERLTQQRTLAEREVARTRKDASLQPVAQYHLARLSHLVRRFEEVHHRKLLPAFARAEGTGQLLLLTTCATHAFLPLLRNMEEAVQAQVSVGVEEYARLFGRRPRGFWLPECGYYPGLERALAKEELRFTFLEARGVVLAEPRPVSSVYAPLFTESGVAVYGRDPESSEEVWSAESGYPSDGAYLDFHKDAGWELPLSTLEPFLQKGEARRGVGLRYHRVTGRTEEKALYAPEAARRQAQAHGQHFVQRRLARLEQLLPLMPGRPPVLLAPYDAELFGHWWHEGPFFLEALFREAQAQGLALKTPLEDLEAFPEAQLAAPSESSWGSQGSARTWLDPSNDWIPPEVHRATRALKAETRVPRHAPKARALLNQAARELLLAQSSDFPFILRAGTVVDYAEARVRTHLSRFWALLEAAHGRAVEETLVKEALSEDVLFPGLEFRAFAEAAGAPGKARPGSAVKPPDEG
jgi:1,4-alpha-glucan branching enzyme